MEKNMTSSKGTAIKRGSAMSSPVVSSRHVLKRHSMRFAAALLVALASLVVGPNAAPAAAPQHHKQVPGFYRLKVGDLEVTALFDGAAVGAPDWLKGTTATMDGVAPELCTELDRCDFGSHGTELPACRHR
jgi:hypothetical protein